MHECTNESILTLYLHFTIFFYHSYHVYMHISEIILRCYIQWGHVVKLTRGSSLLLKINCSFKKLPSIIILQFKLVKAGKVFSTT